MSGLSNRQQKIEDNKKGRYDFLRNRRVDQIKVLEFNYEQAKAIYEDSKDNEEITEEHKKFMVEALAMRETEINDLKKEWDVQA
jgi:DNA-binding transcriptional MerR regulator